MSHRIVFLDRATVESGVNVRRPAFEHEWVEHDRTASDAVVENLAGATIAITNKVPLRRASLEKLPELKLIAVAATGTDVIDKDCCRERGIVVSNIQGYAVSTVPEHTFALMLALKRAIVGYREDVRAGEWKRAGQFCFFTHPITELRGSRLGIIGEGSLGQGVASIARAFGMHVMFAAHKGVEGLGPLYTPWDEVIETSDVITLHAPLTPATRNVLAMPEFRRMKRRPFIINTARGGLVDESDLAKALREGLISGAGFDVVTTEPLPEGHVFHELLELPNFILTPHVAWASREAMQILCDQLIDNIENFVRGTPSNVVGGEF